MYTAAAERLQLAGARRQLIDAVSRLTGRRAISPPPNPTRPTKIRKQRIIGSRRRRRLEIDGRHFRLGKQHGFRNRSFAPPPEHMSPD